MNKIIFITNRLPFPKTDGRKNILFQYIEQVKKSCPDCKLINLSFVDDDKYLKDKPELIDELILLKKPNVIEKLYNILLNSFILQKWPLQVSMYYSRSTYKKIKNIILKEKPQYIFYDMVRVAEYYLNEKEGDMQTILNYDDLLSLRYKRQMDWIDYIPSIFGGITKSINKNIRRFLEFKKIQKKILEFESKLLEKYEINCSKKFDHLIFTSPKEANDFKKKTNHPSCVGIPMVFDVGRLSNTRRYDPNKIVFLGKMDIPHNVSAVFYFLENIWPKIKASYKNARFYIIGKSPTKEVLKLSEIYEDVIVTGPVDDIKKALSDAAVLVAPLVFGTGIKTKIIEAMSMGIPVVSTPIGAEGIIFENGREIFVTEDSEEFASFTVSLMRNKDLNQKVSEAAYMLVKNVFSERNNLAHWNKIFK